MAYTFSGLTREQSIEKLREVKNRLDCFLLPAAGEKIPYIELAGLGVLLNYTHTDPGPHEDCIAEAVAVRCAEVNMLLCFAENLIERGC